MGDTTHISWADATWNPWLGCQKTGSPACVPCYAEHLVEHRFGRAKWGGPHEGPGTRVKTSPTTWAIPRKLERHALKDGTRPFCFTLSLGDIFDPVVPPEWRAEAFVEMRATPHVVYLLLTKRPHLIIKLAEEAGGLPPNAAILCTVVTQEEVERDVPHLLLAKAALKPLFAGLSIEPMVEAIDLTRITTLKFRGAEVLNALTGRLEGMFGDYCPTRLPPIDWVICGGMTDQGEHKATPVHPDWIRALRDQCAPTETPFHLKQWGEWAPGEIVQRQTGTVETAHWFDDRWTFGKENLASTDGHGDDEPTVYRIGKKATGRTLDGVVHDARPEVSA